MGESASGGVRRIRRRISLIVAGPRAKVERLYEQEEGCVDVLLISINMCDPLLLKDCLEAGRKGYIVRWARASNGFREEGTTPNVYSTVDCESEGNIGNLHHRKKRGRDWNKKRTNCSCYVVLTWFFLSMCMS